MTYRILFVCLGNICRSPSAETVLRAKAHQRGLDLFVDSAGTGNWHVGKPPYGPMQEAARARGYEMSDLRARQVRGEDFKCFDLIIAMDQDNMRNLQHLKQGALRAQVSLLTDYVPNSAIDHVPDPYYTRDFDGALDLIEQASDGVLDHLMR